METISGLIDSGIGALKKLGHRSILSCGKGQTNSYWCRFLRHRHGYIFCKVSDNIKQNSRCFSYLADLEAHSQALHLELPLRRAMAAHAGS